MLVFILNALAQWQDLYMRIRCRIALAELLLGFLRLHASTLRVKTLCLYKGPCTRMKLWEVQIVPVLSLLFVLQSPAH